MAGPVGSRTRQDGTIKCRTAERPPTSRGNHDQAPIRHPERARGSPWPSRPPRGWRTSACLDVVGREYCPNGWYRKTPIQDAAPGHRGSAGFAGNGNLDPAGVDLLLPPAQAGKTVDPRAGPSKPGDTANRGRAPVSAATARCLNRLRVPDVVQQIRWSGRCCISYRTSPGQGSRCPSPCSPAQSGWRRRAGSTAASPGT